MLVIRRTAATLTHWHRAGGSQGFAGGQLLVLPSVTRRRQPRDLHTSCPCKDATPLRDRKATDGPGLAHFIEKEQRKRLPNIDPSPEQTHPYLTAADLNGDGRKVKFVTYGCQMNVNDTEVVRSVLFGNGYAETDSFDDADVVLLMTCSIREGAETKIWDKLQWLRAKKNIRLRRKQNYTVGILGCMAERLKQQLLEKNKSVDIVAGPDSYRDLPRLLAVANTGQSAVNVQLSLEETYADISPVRVDETSTTAFVSIMRGCDNMCTYCIVPYTRGRERSRPIDSIVEEIRRLSDQGVKQVTLLGQNVNSYRDMSESIHFTESATAGSSVADGFTTVYKAKTGGRPFSALLDKVSEVDPEMRIRFTSPHPKDFPHEVLQLISERANICKQLHLPAQSGNDSVLEAMGRGYSRETYLRLVDDIRTFMPNVLLTSDFIAGFCGETEEAHQDTLSLIHQVKYDFCFVFPYSMREKTRAHRRLKDDVPEDVKARRHMELAEAFRIEAHNLHQQLVGTEQVMLVEKASRRSEMKMVGRIDGGTKVIVDNTTELSTHLGDGTRRHLQPGDYVHVEIMSATSQTLEGRPISIRTLRQSQM